MPWTDSFSILTDEHLSFYEAHAIPAEKRYFQSLFANRRLGLKEFASNIVCLALSPGLQQEGRAGPSRSPAAPEELVSSILERCRLLAVYQQDTVLRVYLDPAWESFSAELLEGGCEVILMEHPSDGPNPARLWRYLALEEEGKALLFLDVHELELLEDFLERTQALLGSGLKAWRTPLDRRRNYRPIHPDRFCCLQSYPAADLLRAFAWHVQTRETAHHFPEPGCILQASAASERQASWKQVDLDEFFLLSAIYPRAAFDGLLTLVEADDQHSRWLLLDIEYATWANPASEALFARHLHQAQTGGTGVPDSHLVAATLEKLFHANRYPDFFAGWEGETGDGEFEAADSGFRDGISSLHSRPSGDQGFLPPVPLDGRLPKLIWQGRFSRESLPGECESCVRSWFSQNPAWSHQLCTDESIREFVETFCSREIRDLFGRLSSPGMKLDLWRYAVLYEFGGICSDIDTICREPLDQWLDVERGKGLHIACANDDPYFCHRTIAAAKGHPALALAMELIAERVAADDGVNSSRPDGGSYYTGADLWTNAVFRYLGREGEPMTLYHERSSFDGKDVEIHPCYFFDGVKARHLALFGRGEGA